jgi:hypothetical protein
MQVLEWVQDTIAARRISRVSQSIMQSSSIVEDPHVPEGPVNSGDALDVSVRTDSPEVVPRETTILWAAPTEEKQTDTVQDDSESENPAVSEQVPFTLLGTGLLRPDEDAAANLPCQINFLRDRVCRPVSCFPAPATKESKKSLSDARQPPEVIGLPLEDESKQMTSQTEKEIGQPSSKAIICAIPRESEEISDTSRLDEDRNSAMRRAIREALQRRQAELIGTVGLNSNVQSNDSEVSESSSNFLKGRTKRVVELLKEAEARFDAKLKSRTVNVSQGSDKEADDELLA